MIEIKINTFVNSILVYLQDKFVKYNKSTFLYMNNEHFAEKRKKKKYR